MTSAAYILPHQPVSHDHAAGGEAMRQYMTYAYQQQAPAMYTFKARTRRIDWKTLAATDVDRMARNLDENAYRAIQDNIINVTYCNIEAEIDTLRVDQNFLKLFKLAQFTIEYLLHAQDLFKDKFANVENERKTYQQEITACKAREEKLKKDLETVKKECHTRKKYIKELQQMIQAGPHSVNKCAFCEKVYHNMTYLHAHIKRRHEDRIAEYNAIVAGAQVGAGVQTSFISLQQQQVPQQQQEVQQQAQQVSSARDEEERRKREEAEERLRAELETIRRRQERTEQELVEERNARNTLQQRLRQEYEQNLIEQEKKHNAVAKKKDKQVEMLMREIRETSTKLHTAENRAAASQRGSRLGELQDDEDDRDYQAKQKQAEEYERKMKELEAKIQNIDHVVDEKVSQAVAKPEDGGTAVEAFELHDMESEVESEHQQDDIHMYSKQLEERENSATPTPKRVTMQEMEDDTDDDDTEEFAGNSSMHTSGAGTTLRTIGTTGSLSLDGTRNQLLREQLKKNPQIMKNLKSELASLLDERLEQRGVAKGTPGLTKNVVENKLSILKTERFGTAKKYPLFYDIRQACNDEADKLALEQLKQQRRSQGPPPSSPHTPRSRSAGQITGAAVNRKSPATAATSALSPGPNSKTPLPVTNTSTPLRQPQGQPQAPRPHSTPSGVSQPRSPQAQRPHSSVESPKLSRSSPAPRPAPRAASPDKLRASAQSAATTTNMSTKTSRDFSSTGRSSYTAGTMDGTGTYTTTGSSWSGGSGEEDSEEEDYTETDRPTPTPRQNKGKSPRHLPQQQQQQQQQKQQQHRKQQQQDDDEEDDWDDDSISELDVLDPEARQVRSPTQSQQVPLQGSGNVKRLSQQIGRQLSGRDGKKPAGGVNTMPADEEDEESESGSHSLVSVTDEETPRPKAPSSRKTPTRGSVQTESDNTYGTSVWESGRGAKSRQSKASTLASSDEDQWESPASN